MFQSKTLNFLNGIGFSSGVNVCACLVFERKKVTSFERWVIDNRHLLTIFCK